MKFLKIGLILTALTLFIFACSQAPSNTSSTNTSNATTKAQNSNAAAAPSNTNAGNGSSPATDELAAFKSIYTEKCILCHKDTGEGGPVDIEGDKFKVPSFKSPGALKADDKDFTHVITDGEEKMPAFGKKLKPEEITGLIKYIRKEFQGK